MRLLVAGTAGHHSPVPVGTDLDPATLFDLYAPPRRPWLRCNMVSSLDGAATGLDGRSGSLNNEADHVVFELLRAHAHAVVVGSGTLRDEGYTTIGVDDAWRELRSAAGLPEQLPIVAVGNSGEVPPVLRGNDDGSVLLATRSGAPGLAAARESIGADNVIVCGDDVVDLPGVLSALHERGLTSLLSEGGPSLLGSMLDAGLVDELCFTFVPRIVGGDHPRAVRGPQVPADLHLETLVEQDGTLLGRWFTGS